RFAIESHRKISAVALGRQCPDSLTFLQIDNRDLPCIGQVDKGSCGAFVYLKTLRVRLKRYVRNVRPALRVDDGEGTLAVADKQPVTRSIDPDIVGVLTEIEAAFARQVFRS